MTSTPTALMPIDPAVSPAQVSRVLTIRANLLPDEIRADRNARRTKVVLIGAVIAVIAALAGWYLYAVQQVSTANENLTTAADQVRRAQNDKKKYSGAQQIIDDRDAVKADLKTLLATDLPWAATMDSLRADAKATDVVISAISGTVLEDDSAPTGTAARAKPPVATLAITGTAPDKKHVAAFLDRLANHKGVTDPYLTTAAGEVGITYALTAKLTKDALCGRFTTDCPATGGN
jgi:Tfp pilus assembly protein PilN